MSVFVLALGVWSTINGISPAWVAVIGTVVGGVCLKLVERWLSNSKVKVDDAMNIRNELRTELVALREENRQLEDDVTKWREEYYDLRDKVVSLNTYMTLNGLTPPDEGK